MEFIFTSKAEKQFKKLNPHIQKQIKIYIEGLEKLDNPRNEGKALIGNLKGFWRYKTSDYRIVCQIEDNQLIILVLAIGHRKDIYD